MLLTSVAITGERVIVLILVVFAIDSIGAINPIDTISSIGFVVSYTI
jgi:hypothetical protein